MVAPYSASCTAGAADESGTMLTQVAIITMARRTADAPVTVGRMTAYRLEGYNILASH